MYDLYLTSESWLHFALNVGDIIFTISDLKLKRPSNDLDVATLTFTPAARSDYWLTYRSSKLPQFPSSDWEVTTAADDVTVDDVIVGVGVEPEVDATESEYGSLPMRPATKSRSACDLCSPADQIQIHSVI